MQFRKKKPSKEVVGGFQKELHRLQFVLIGVLGVVLLAGIGASVYVYRLIYTSLSQVQEIVAQKGALSAAIIEFGKYEQVEQAWTKKYATEPLVITRDPFTDASVAVVAPAVMSER